MFVHTNGKWVNSKGACMCVHLPDGQLPELVSHSRRRIGGSPATLILSCCTSAQCTRPGFHDPPGRAQQPCRIRPPQPPGATPPWQIRPLARGSLARRNPPTSKLPSVPANIERPARRPAKRPAHAQLMHACTAQFKSVDSFPLRHGQPHDESQTGRDKTRRSPSSLLHVFGLSCFSRFIVSSFLFPLSNTLSFPSSTRKRPPPSPVSFVVLALVTFMG